MGRFTYVTYDPDDLELPNDVDFELEGIDEAYGCYQEYAAYLPDRVLRLQPVDERAHDACQSAAHAVASACSQIAASDEADALAQLFLCLEAVSTVRIEDYSATCMSMLEYRAAASSDRLFVSSEAEDAAIDAADALNAFVVDGAKLVTLDEICDANALFARSSSRAEYCGELRERPVFIGRSLFDAEFVPPPADVLDEYLDDLVRFVNTRDGIAPFAKAAIAHAQLVTIHPFEDGNGRTSRAIAQRVLRTEGPTGGLVLPSAAALLARKLDYFNALQCMRSLSGPADPSRFVEFFAACCERAAGQMLTMWHRVEDTLAQWEHAVPRNDAAINELMRAFVATPIMTEAMASSVLSKGADEVLKLLLRANILHKVRSSYCGLDIYEATDIMNIVEDALQLS